MPRIDAGITGDPANKLTMAPLGKTVLRADQRTLDVLQKHPAAGIELVGHDQISISNERVLAAHARIQDLSYQAIQQIARVDLEKPDGGVEPGSVDLLLEKGILDTDGRLTQLGTDVVLVRDDHVLRERAALAPAQQTTMAQYFKTSGDSVRETMPHTHQHHHDHHHEFDEGIEL
jgi:hypothetical protein